MIDDRALEEERGAIQNPIPIRGRENGWLAGERKGKGKERKEKNMSGTWAPDLRNLKAIRGSGVRVGRATAQCSLPCVQQQQKDVHMRACPSISHFALVAQARTSSVDHPGQAV